jgi:hypothetical protein
LDGVQSFCGVSAALPTLSLKQVSAERMVVTIRKERMNFMVMFSVVVFAAVAFFIGVPSCMIRDYGEKQFMNIGLGGLRGLRFWGRFVSNLVT